MEGRNSKLSGPLDGEYYNCDLDEQLYKRKDDIIHAIRGYYSGKYGHVVLLQALDQIINIDEMKKKKERIERDIDYFCF